MKVNCVNGDIVGKYLRLERVYVQLGLRNTLIGNIDEKMKLTALIHKGYVFFDMRTRQGWFPLDKRRDDS